MAAEQSIDRRVGLILHCVQDSAILAMTGLFGKKFIRAGQKSPTSAIDFRDVHNQKGDRPLYILRR